VHVSVLTSHVSLLAGPYMNLSTSALGHEADAYNTGMATYLTNLFTCAYSGL